MAAKRKHRQAALNRQYADLITNAKALYNDMYLALRLGPGTPTFEELLNYAGTKSGLKKPTKQSIKALKKMQTELGILQQAYGKLNIKSEAFRAVSKMIEQEHKLKEAAKKAAAKKKKQAEQAEKKRQAEEKRQDREQKRKQKEADKWGNNVNAIRTVFKAAKDIHLDMSQRKYMTPREENIWANSGDFISQIEAILANDDIDTLIWLNNSCQRYINQYGVPGMYDFYKEAYGKLCAEIFEWDPMKQLQSDVIGPQEPTTDTTAATAPTGSTKADKKEDTNFDPFETFNMLDELDGGDEYILE